MNKETIKSFILAVLVALSFLLSYILWSYQPKYEMFYDANYISEVDIGGKDRSKSEIIRPTNIVFHEGIGEGNTSVRGFIRPSDEYIFYKEMTTWSLTNFNVTDLTANTVLPQESHYIEVVFPDDLSANVIEHMFSIQEEVEFPDWNFDRLYIVEEADAHLTVRVNSSDQREQLQASIEKAGALQTVHRYMEEHPHLQTYVTVPFGEQPIYIPYVVEEASKKTLVANRIDAELFMNALFSNPSLVKPNQEASFFTDGQRGMRIFQGGRYLEFIHPIETNDDPLDGYTLLDKSIGHINEHKGWNNEYHFASLSPGAGRVKYRLHYDGVPVFDFNNLSVIEQIWREQELYQYRRSLLNIGHLLNQTDVSLPNSDEVIRTLQQAEAYDLDKINEIQLGYYLNYIDEVHSLTLEPTWFMHYENSWLRVPFAEEEKE